MTKTELRQARQKRTITDPDIFAKRLGAILKEKGIAKTTLEKDGIININTLYSYLAGEIMPSARILQSLCSYVGVSADYLLGISNVKDPVKSWVFIKGMWCCPYCNEAGEPGNRFCPNCGRRLNVE